jgi:hypothetical protein
MTWTYTFHRFTNRAAFDAVYDAAGFKRLTGATIPLGMNGRMAPPETVVFDVCETLHDPAEYNSQGVMTKPAVALTGFHVNVAWTGEMPSAFKASEVFPTVTRRVFA